LIIGQNSLNCLLDILESVHSISPSQNTSVLLNILFVHSHIFQAKSHISSQLNNLATFFQLQILSHETLAASQETGLLSSLYQSHQ
jgi:hypothetical protein